MNGKLRIAIGNLFFALALRSYPRYLRNMMLKTQVETLRRFNAKIIGG